jgi:flagellar hook-length control protein FliK
VPHVASKANVLKSQQPGQSQRERMPEAKDNTSPFSILLAETGGSAEPARQPSTRIVATSATQRNDGPRKTTKHDDTQRPEPADAENAAEAPEACTAEAAAMEQPEDAAAQFELAVATQLTVKTEPEQSAETTTDEPAAGDAAITVDTAIAAVVEAPVVPAQPAAEAETLPLAAAAVAPPPTAAAPADTGTPEPDVAAAPIGAVAPAQGEAAADVAAPTAAQASDAQQAPQAADQPAQQAEHTAENAPAPIVPEPKQAKPAAEPATITEATDEPQTTVFSTDAVTEAEPAAPATTATTPAQPEAKAEPHKPVHAEAHAQASARSNAPDAPERPQTTGSTVSDFVQATHPTPDSSHLAHLQSGREFGQSVAAAAQASHAADATNPLVSAPVPLETLAVEIATRAQGGSNRFEIRLDPPELGRIDVRLDIDRSGNVTSRLMVEKAETLDVLRRDAHQLERALQDAGLKTSDNSLQFSLRDQSFNGRNDQGNSNNPRLLIDDAELLAAESAAATYGVTARGNGGIDIRV